MYDKQYMEREFAKIYQQLGHLEKICIREISREVRIEKFDAEVIEWISTVFKYVGIFEGSFTDLTDMLWGFHEDEMFPTGLPRDAKHMGILFRQNKSQFEDAGLCISRYGPNSRFIRISTK